MKKIITKEKKKRRKSIKTANPENYKDKNHAFNVAEAIKYNIEKAIILYNMRFWLDKNKANNKNIFQSKTDGNCYVWTYNSGTAFEKLFPYMKSKSVLKWLNELTNDGILITENFNERKYDKTNWYTIKDEYKVEKCISPTEPSISPTEKWTSPTEKWTSPTEKWTSPTEQPIPYINIYKQNINSDIVSATAEDISFSEKNNLISPENKTPQHTESSNINDRPANSPKSSIFSFSEKLEEMKNDKKRHIQIIALYWKFKEFNYTNEKQYKSAISRDLRASSRLSGYTDDQIIKTMEWLKINATDYTWKLETVHKFIDEKGENTSPSNIDPENYNEETGITYRDGSLKFSELSEDEQVKYLVDMAKRIKHNAEQVEKIDLDEIKKDFKKSDNKPLERKDITFINF